VALSAKELTIGLVLIVVGLLADIGATYALPAPKACSTLTCNVAEAVGLVSLLLLVVGIGLQVRALSREPATTPVGPAPSLTSPPLPPWAAASPPSAPASLPPVPSAVPVRPYNGVTPPAPASAGGPEIRCGRCGRTYAVGQFAYCPACGNPLPFAP
jgi:hypothetical protein